MAREPGDWLKAFADSGRPDAWWITADRLKAAGDLLWDSYRAGLHMPADEPPGRLLPIEWALPGMMLYGLSLECLAKGLLVKQKPELARPGKMPKWPTADLHDIEGLYAATGVALSTPEREVLSRLRDFVRWRGRYPMPSKVDELYPRDAVPAGGTPFVMSSDRGRIDQLYERLQATW